MTVEYCIVNSVQSNRMELYQNILLKLLNYLSFHFTDRAQNKNRSNNNYRANTGNKKIWSKINSNIKKVKIASFFLALKKDILMHL